ncbi:MAG: hypothetical protein ACK40X_10960 [Armatimonadota bacterium]
MIWVVGHGTRGAEYKFQQLSIHDDQSAHLLICRTADWPISRTADLLICRTAHLTICRTAHSPCAKLFCGEQK